MGALHGIEELLTSYRSELYGMTFEKITQYCNIKETESITTPIYYHNQEVATKADRHREASRGTGQYICAAYDFLTIPV